MTVLLLYYVILIDGILENGQVCESCLILLCKAGKEV